MRISEEKLAKDIEERKKLEATPEYKEKKEIRKRSQTKSKRRL